MPHYIFKIDAPTRIILDGIHQLFFIHHIQFHHLTLQIHQTMQCIWSKHISSHGLNHGKFHQNPCKSWIYSEICIFGIFSLSIFIWSSQAKDEKIPKPRPIVKKLHTIFPALKKRYVRDTTATYEQKFYLDHHRRTRHRLYKIIEKYLFAWVFWAKTQFSWFAYHFPFVCNPFSIMMWFLLIYKFMDIAQKKQGLQWNGMCFENTLRSCKKASWNTTGLIFSGNYPSCIQVRNIYLS